VETRFQIDAAVVTVAFFANREVCFVGRSKPQRLEAGGRGTFEITTVPIAPEWDDDFNCPRPVETDLMTVELGDIAHRELDVKYRFEER
jgi:hypothetical protein